MGIPVTEIRDAAAWKKAHIAVSHASIVVDALFGTGLERPLEGLYAAAVDDINRSGAFKVAVDIPSGLSADRFEIIGPSVEADLTVALAAPKVAHIFPPAAERVGELVVAPIGIPPALFESPSLKLELVEAAATCQAEKDTHKGTYGHLLIVAGSVGKSGAAALAGRAALRTGAGLVTVATAAGVLPSIARTMAELMTEPLAETPEGTIAATALPRAVALLKGKNAVLIGPGLSTNSSTAEFVLGLLPKIKAPCVIDADGLNMVSGKLDVLGRMAGPVVLTPHPGEFARLTGLANEEVVRRRLTLVPEFAAKHGVIVVPGYRTLIAAPDGRVFVNPTGNPGIATGGTGDVLGGMIASELAQEKDVLGAVIAAVYAHGLAGDIAAERLSEKALVAGDIVRYLPAVQKALAGSERLGGRHDALGRGDFRAGPVMAESKGRRSPSSPASSAGRPSSPRVPLPGPRRRDRSRLQPSFTLVNIYEGRWPVFHIDLTGSSGGRDPDLGWEDYLGEGSSSSSGPSG
jgi:NAD(P)H-hydrate epimerase